MFPLGKLSASACTRNLVGDIQPCAMVDLGFLEMVGCHKKTKGTVTTKTAPFQGLRQSIGNILKRNGWFTKPKEFKPLRVYSFPPKKGKKALLRQVC